MIAAPLADELLARDRRRVVSWRRFYLLRVAMTRTDARLVTRLISAWWRGSDARWWVRGRNQNLAFVEANLAAVGGNFAFVEANLAGVEANPAGVEANFDDFAGKQYHGMPTTPPKNAN